MKKFLVILAAIAAFSVSANAQRRLVSYVSLGPANKFVDVLKLHPGPAASIGFRDYNQDAIVSFTYGGEVFGYWIPDNGSNLFGAYAIPEIGVAIGPRGFKVYPHAGFMMGYGSDAKAFSTGTKSGLGFDFGDHVTLDFSGYYAFSQTWTTAVNFLFRF